MDHRDPPEPTAEPVAQPAPIEAPAHDGILAAPSAANEVAPVAGAQAESGAVDDGPSEPPVADAAPRESQSAVPALEHEVQAPVASEPEPAAIEPPATEPIASEPPATETIASEPPATETIASEPPASESVANEPAVSEPAVSEPAVSEPAVSEPAASETAVSELVARETTTNEPGVGDAVAADAVPGEPVTPPPVDPRRLRAQQAWERVVAAHASGEAVSGTVTAAVKGGLLVDVSGIRGFLPASQVRVPIGTAIEALVKTKVPLKVLDIDAGRRRIVVSQRRAVDEDRRSKRAELLRTLEVGQVREAVVARLADFGAFVDLGGVDGLIPMRELAFERVEKTADVVSVGDRVTVQVLRIEEGGKKIALSRKNALPDPWRDHAALLRNGTTHEGRVVAKEPHLVVELAPGVTGSVRPDDADPADYELGEAIEVTVRSVDRMRRRINLTTVQAAAAAAAASAAAAPAQQTSSMTASGFAPLGIELAQRKK